MDVQKIAPGTFAKGDWLLIPEGSYYQQKIALAVKVEKEEIEAGEREVKGLLTGTRSEELLKFGTAQGACQVRLHLCQASCTQVRENPDLVHVRKVKKIRAEDPKSWGKQPVGGERVPGVANRGGRMEEKRNQKERRRKR